jgi:lysophospholipid acyltransferase (LPLAT)-like uncharacterized protein
MTRAIRHALVLSLARLWMRTWRLRGPGASVLPERGVLVLWHEHLPACIPAFAGRRIGVLVSRSADGGLAAEACRRLGYRVFRGSGTRGALSGLRALARGMGEAGGGLAGMALDGPRGPRRDPKPGSLWLAEAAGVPVFPIAVKAGFALRLKTWDRCLLPLPFAKVVVRVGPACRPADSEALRRAMEANQELLDRP